MIMLKHLFIILLFLSFSKDCFSQTKRLREAGNISMVEVLVNPEEFHGRKILLHGIFISEIENSALYLAKQSAEYGISAEAIWVRFTDGYEHDLELKKLIGKYVSIYGMFDKDQFGHMGAFRGTILAEKIRLMPRFRKL